MGSFEEFFEEAWPEAFRLAVFLTGSRSDGEEVAQDALVAVYRQWDHTDRPNAYLRTTLVNRARNEYRNQQRRRSKLPLLITSARSEPAGNELTDVLAALPFRQRAVVVLRYYLDLSEKEIAELLGCRPGTVKSLSSRALSRLAEEIPR